MADLVEVGKASEEDEDCDDEDFDDEDCDDEDWDDEDCDDEDSDDEDCDDEDAVDGRKFPMEEPNKHNVHNLITCIYGYLILIHV